MLALGVGIFPAPSAQAHGTITNTFPKQGSTVSKIPALVWMEFDGNLIDIAKKQSNFMIIKDSKGRVLDDGHAFVGGARLNVKIKNLLAIGKITVDWRAVSEDGHPIKGSYSFMVSSKAKS